MYPRRELPQESLYQKYAKNGRALGILTGTAGGLRNLIKGVRTKLKFLMHDVAKSYDCLLSATVSQIACVLMLIMISVCSCEQKRDPALTGPSVLEIQKTNKIRKQLGLREIKDTWNFYYRDLNVTSGKIPNINAKT